MALDLIRINMTRLDIGKNLNKLALPLFSLVILVILTGVFFATKQGGKRRSKNDNAGRDFKCKYCDKTYLSYPALYTHMKQKHSKGPDGELRNPPTSGRGRGRPRKNPY